MEGGQGQQPPILAPSGAWRPQNKSQLEKWQKLMASAETLRAQTIDFAECIPPPEYIPQRGLVRRTHYVQEGPGPVMMEPPAVANKLMDGFLLLEACHVELPDQARRADVNGREIGDVALEDLQYFTNLAYLDIGDNRAPFDPLGTLPVLRELHIQCNLIEKISPIEGFKFLEVLDLSYNALLPASVGELAAMPKLRELDLTCNGLQELPDMSGFVTLEVLILERNRFGNETISALSPMPKLKVLNAGFNYINAMPTHLETEPGFPHLEELNLSNNYIAMEEDIFPLVYLPRLQLVILYGNPLTEEVQERELLASAEGKITTITEVPDVTKHRPTQGTYITNDMRHIHEPERRKFGTAAELPALESGAEMKSLPSAAEVKETDAEVGRQEAEGKEEEAAPKDNTFITGMDMEDALREPEEGEKGSAEEEEEGLPVPEMVLTRTLAAENPPNPAKLRSAVNALRYALKHPLTSHSSFPQKNQRLVDRPTFSHMCRQRQRRPFVSSKEAAKQKAQGQEKNLDTIEDVLDQMNDRLTAAEHDVDSALNSDDNMTSLVNMVGKVMDTYEGY